MKNQKCKSKPTLFVGELELKFKKKADYNIVNDLLSIELLLETVVGEVDTTKNLGKIYLITELGSLIELNFDFKVKKVTSIKVTTYIKDMICFKIKKIIAYE